MILDAADLGTGFIQTYLIIRPFIDAYNAGNHGSARAHLTERRRRTVETVARLARVALLFGRNSPAATSAAEIVSLLSQGLLEAEHYPKGVPQARAHFDAATDLYGEFNRLAHDVIARRWWRPS